MKIIVLLLALVLTWLCTFSQNPTYKIRKDTLYEIVIKHSNTSYTESWSAILTGVPRDMDASTAAQYKKEGKVYLTVPRAYYLPLPFPMGYLFRERHIDTTNYNVSLSTSALPHLLRNEFTSTHEIGNRSRLNIIGMLFLLASVFVPLYFSRSYFSDKKEYGKGGYLNYLLLSFAVPAMFFAVLHLGSQVVVDFPKKNPLAGMLPGSMISGIIGVILYISRYKKLKKAISDTSIALS